MEMFGLSTIYLCLALVPIAYGLNDITTLYKINTLKFDNNMEDVKYLNTCTVSVHVPVKDAQLPLFKIHGDGHTVNVSLEDETTKTVEQLPCHELDRVDTTAGLERVLTKVNISSWIGKKRIRIGGNIVMGNIWESTELDKYKVEGPKSCIKSNRMDIYNTLERISGTREPVDTCFNGGRVKNDINCTCPPGFTGNQCQVTCGRDRFGKTCSKKCSTSSNESNECKGMILCTPDYGCTCAPGYYGDKCIEQYTLEPAVETVAKEPLGSFVHKLVTNVTMDVTDTLEPAVETVAKEPLGSFVHKLVTNVTMDVTDTLEPAVETVAKEPLGSFVHKLVTNVTMDVTDTLEPAVETVATELLGRIVHKLVTNVTMDVTDTLEPAVETVATEPLGSFVHKLVTNVTMDVTDTLEPAVETVATEPLGSFVHKLVTNVTMHVTDTLEPAVETVATEPLGGLYTNL
ncbi:hypothetical protein WDU94_005951 [Cyamophila willieti]